MSAGGCADGFVLLQRAHGKQKPGRGFRFFFLLPGDPILAAFDRLAKKAD